MKIDFDENDNPIARVTRTECATLSRAARILKRIGVIHVAATCAKNVCQHYGDGNFSEPQAWLVLDEPGTENGTDADISPDDNS